MKSLVLAAALTALLGCQAAGPAYSRVRLHLTDAPAPNIESAVVYISRAYLVPGDSGNGVDVSTTAQSYDLLTLQNGVTTLIGDATVPAARYAQLRLVVDSARLTLAAGSTFDDGSNTALLTVPSGARTGIKVSFPGTLDLTQNADVVVDFDVAQNFVFNGPSTGPFRVLFTPTLKGTAQVQ